MRERTRADEFTDLCPLPGDVRCFGSLKTELELTSYEDSLEAVRELSSYVRYDNQDRRHSSLGYVTPTEFEERSTVPSLGHWRARAT
jgi:hypothetical protein